MDAQTFQALVDAMVGGQQPEQAAPMSPLTSAAHHVQPLVGADNGQSVPMGADAGQQPNRIQPLVAPTGGGGYMGVSAEPPPSAGPGEISGLGASQLGSMLDIPHHTTGIGQGISNLGSGVGHAIGTIARMLSGGGGGGMGGGMGMGMMKGGG